MIKILLGTILGFIAGMYYTIYQIVEVEESKVIGIIKTIKGIWEVM